MKCHIQHLGIVKLWLVTSMCIQKTPHCHSEMELCILLVYIECHREQMTVHRPALNNKSIIHDVLVCHLLCCFLCNGLSITVSHQSTVFIPIENFNSSYNFSLAIAYLRPQITCMSLLIHRYMCNNGLGLYNFCIPYELLVKGSPKNSVD